MTITPFTYKDFYQPMAIIINEMHKYEPVSLFVLDQLRNRERGSDSWEFRSRSATLFLSKAGALHAIGTRERNLAAHKQFVSLSYEGISNWS
jgi:hypothetical protein